MWVGVWKDRYHQQDEFIFPVSAGFLLILAPYCAFGPGGLKNKTYQEMETCKQTGEATCHIACLNIALSASQLA